MKQKDQSSAWQEGIAYIIETREHSNLQIVVENIDKCLPDGWQIWFFHSNENSKYIDENCLKSSSKKYEKILLDLTINNLNDYNKLLLNESFWQKFTKENLLCFQVDTCINTTQKNRLEELCTFDYVGAPWSESIIRRWSNIPKLGGNGGFCFSKKSQRLKALSECTIPKNSDSHPNEFINEDIWFSNAYMDIHANLPSRQLAQSLLVESSFFATPFAVHKPWNYVSPTELQTLYDEIPELEKLHIGCVSPLISIPASPTKEERCYEDIIRRNLLNSARDYMKNDNIYYADGALQISHSYFPEDPKTLNLQAMLGFSIGAYEQALDFAKQALDKQPNFKKAQDNYNIIQQRIETNRDLTEKPNKKFLLLHSLGKGLAYDLINLAGHQLLSEILDRELVFYWGNHSCTDTAKDENIYDKLFESTHKIEVSDLKEYQHHAFPEHWKKTPLKQFKRRTNWLDKSNGQRYYLSNIEFFNRSEQLIVCTELASIQLLKAWLTTNHEYKSKEIHDIYKVILEKFFKPKSIYLKKSDEFIEKSFNNQNFIAIHLRAYDTDTGKKGSLPTKVNEKIIDQINQYPSQTPIFLMTDDHQILSNMQELYGSRLHNYGGVLFKGWVQGYDSKTSLKNTQKSLVEMIIAQKAQHFYGTGYSHFDCCIDFLRHKNSHLQHPNLMLRYISPPTIARR